MPVSLQTSVGPVIARLAIGLAVALSAGSLSFAQDQQSDKAVEVVNGSEPVLCAEKDNVTLSFSNPQVRRFRIEAAHPVYLSSLQRDNWKADWTACDFGPEPPRPAGAKPPKPPQRTTIYEEPAQWLVGWRFDHFWRPSTATFRVGDRVEKGLHLVQLWQIRPNGGEEVLVLYPQDGYWRMRPLGPRGRDLTAFGSSFLVGPIEKDERPLVRLSEIAFDPKARAFTLKFAAGGQAVVTLSEVSAQRTLLDVKFDQAVTGKPFAAMRSMYVTEFNNDVARVAIRKPGERAWHEDGIMTFKGGAVTSLWAGRTVPSRHNTSAPDMIFKSFR